MGAATQESPSIFRKSSVPSPRAQRRNPADVPSVSMVRFLSVWLPRRCPAVECRQCAWAVIPRVKRRSRRGTGRMGRTATSASTRHRHRRPARPAAGGDPVVLRSESAWRGDGAGAGLRDDTSSEAPVVSGRTRRVQAAEVRVSGHAVRRRRANAALHRRYAVPEGAAVEPAPFCRQ